LKKKKGRKLKKTKKKSIRRRRLEKESEEKTERHLSVPTRFEKPKKGGDGYRFRENKSETRTTMD